MISFSFDEIYKYADLFSKLGQFLFGLCALFISIIALFSKKTDLFRSELTKKQFAEMDRIRGLLEQLFFDIYYVHDFLSDCKTMSWSLEEFKSKCPEQWSQSMRYRQNSLDLFYKIGNPSYYLFPKWIERKPLKDFHNKMIEFAPFTIHATGSRTKDELKDYMDSMIHLIDVFDQGLIRYS